MYRLLIFTFVLSFYSCSQFQHSNSRTIASDELNLPENPEEYPELLDLKEKLEAEFSKIFDEDGVIKRFSREEKDEILQTIKELFNKKLNFILKMSEPNISPFKRPDDLYLTFMKGVVKKLFKERTPFNLAVIEHSGNILGNFRTYVYWNNQYLLNDEMVLKTLEKIPSIQQMKNFVIAYRKGVGKIEFEGLTKLVQENKINFQSVSANEAKFYLGYNYLYWDGNIYTTNQEIETLLKTKITEVKHLTSFLWENIHYFNDPISGDERMKRVVRIAQSGSFYNAMKFEAAIKSIDGGHVNLCNGNFVKQWVETLGPHLEFSPPFLK
ncbi:MAG: hypothetical protein H6621_03405 [Halobacteriovoraceae bacterium]|nr:hypothetical protein [Halobacteriovoraceae bacterium]MCB9094094.1 hypothetical protein [Halobacteriovoraceae bacterium]